MAISRRNFFSLGICTAIPPIFLHAASCTQPMATLRTVFIWHGEANKWQQHRLIDVRKGQIISLLESESGEFVEGQEMWLATGNAFEAPSPQIATVMVEPFDPV